MTNMHYRADEQLEELYARVAPSPLFESNDRRMTGWDMEKILAHFASVATVKPLMSVKSGSGEVEAVLTISAPDMADAVAIVRFTDFTDGESSGSRLGITIGTGSRAVTSAYEKILLDTLPPVVIKEPDDDRVFMNFSSFADGHVDIITRQIDAAGWSSVAANYPGVSDTIGKLLAADPATFPGKVGLLSGPPGTGKTTLLRAWAREWRNQANFIYVTDAEEFFTRSQYTLKLLFRAQGNHEWNVLLFEDAEEFITARGKDTHKKALRNLLNVGDGMIGQGLRILTIFTTNAMSTEVDPAVKRKGRCFLDLEVPELTAEQAGAWLASKGSDRRVEKPCVLGDLYGMLA